MLRKLISESYWLENDQLDEIYNFDFNYFSRRVLIVDILYRVLWTFIKKRDVCDFKMPIISGITGS